MRERLRARQSIYSCVLSARCCFFGCIYIFTFSSVTHGFSTWLRNGGGGWMQRVEPDGPDSTWAPEGPAWVTGSPEPSPFPVAGGGPQASGHFSAFALSAPPPSGSLPWTRTKQEEAQGTALPLTIRATGSKGLSLSGTNLLSWEMAAVIPTSGAAVRTKDKPQHSSCYRLNALQSRAPRPLLGLVPRPPPRPGILSSSRPTPPLGEVLQGPPLRGVLQAPRRQSPSLLEKP